MSCIKPWAPARLMAYGLPFDSASTTARTSPSGTLLVRAYVFSSVANFTGFIEYDENGKLPEPEQADKRAAIVTTQRRLRTTGLAFDSARRTGLLRMMSGGLSSPGRAAAPLRIAAFLKTIQLAKQFGFEVVGDVEIFQRDFVFRVL